MSVITSIILPVCDVGLSFILFATCILGYSVYHIQMRGDTNNQARLLNHLYSIFAYVSQAQSLIIFAIVIHTHTSPEDQLSKCVLVNIRALMSFIATQTLILLTVSHLLCHHNPSFYLELSVKMDAKHKWILVVIMFSFSALLMFVIVMSDKLEDPCKPLKGTARALGIAIAVCLFLLSTLLYKTRKLWISFISRGKEFMIILVRITILYDVNYLYKCSQSYILGWQDS